jgi:hypothetical protein
VVACCRWMREKGGGGGLINGDGGLREREMMQSAGKQGCDRVRYLTYLIDSQHFSYATATSDPTSIRDRHWRGEGGAVPCLLRRRRRIRRRASLHAIGQEIGDAEWEGGDS